MKIDLLKEPFLEFGNDFICNDPKIGISIGGFFSLTNKSHRSEIHYSIIGTPSCIEDAGKWIKQFENKIEAIGEEEEDLTDQSLIEDGEVIDYSEEGELFHVDYSFLIPDEEKRQGPIMPVKTAIIQDKKRNPDFPGFNGETQLQCFFVNDEANNKEIQESRIKEIIKDDDFTLFDKAIKVCDLFIDAYDYILSKSITKPTVCFLIIPSEIFKKLSSIPMPGKRWFNLRRYLKAQLITKQNSIPIQIILEDTLRQNRRSLQDISMQAWNFSVASYYKSGCIPWTLSLKDKHTCFIGISFHKVLNETNLSRSSVAQAFNYEGKGLVFVGEHFEWDDDKMETPAPHLTHDYAKNLIKQVIHEYRQFNKNLPPLRVVVHKTTDYWDTAVNPNYAEVEGLKDGIREVLGQNIQIDLVSIKSTDIKLLRETGQYPVMRGTLLQIDKATGILYTTGYIPYFETFPSGHIPRPLEINVYEQESSLRKICEEVLALTKLNFNNCNYYDSLPITIRFAQKVGEISQYIQKGITPPDRYYYYM